MIPAPIDNATLALQELEKQLSAHAVQLAHGLLNDVERAPLNQRASALGLIFDRLMKLEARHAQSGHAVLEVVFRDADDSVHSSPFWEREPHEA